MNIIIKEEYRQSYPISFEKLTRKLLSIIPKKEIAGIGEIIIVDTLYGSKYLTKKGKRTGGQYYFKNKGELAKIKLSLSAIYRGMPRILFYFPLIAEFAFASVLYHEIGHHIQYSTHGIKKENEEDFADKYKTKMLAKRFIFWIIPLIIIYIILKIYYSLKPDK